MGLLPPDLLQSMKKEGSSAKEGSNKNSNKSESKCVTFCLIVEY